VVPHRSIYRPDGRSSDRSRRRRGAGGRAANARRRFAHVLTSPLQRARRTCELAGLGTAFEIAADLTEWDNGDDEGRLRADVIKSRPDWNLFRDGAPNGETAAQVSNRADRFISHLRALDGNVALFSHGHFGRVLGARWIGLSVEQAQHLLFDTAALSVLGYEHDRTDYPAVLLWNSAAPASADPALEVPANDLGPTRAAQRQAVLS
jgi:broad specificity phosphatase PhoE